MHVCTTNADAFTEFGIDDGTDLIHRTYYRLQEAGHGPEVSSEFLAAVARSFRAAFLKVSDYASVPESVDSAIDDAEAILVHRILDAPEADLRTELLPTFYRTVARTYCATRHPPNG